VANRLQAALAQEVYYLVAEGVVSAADVDTALCWGPGMRWGIMGNMMLNHLGGGQGGRGEGAFQAFSQAHTQSLPDEIFVAERHQDRPSSFYKVFHVAQQTKTVISVFAEIVRRID